MSLVEKYGQACLEFTGLAGSGLVFMRAFRYLKNNGGSPQ